MMPAVSANPLSSVTKLTHAADGKSAAADTGQTFNNVLSREMSRQGSESAPQSAVGAQKTTESADSDVAITDVMDGQDTLQSEQMAVAPWLLMLQQQVPPGQLPQQVVLAGDLPVEDDGTDPSSVDYLLTAGGLSLLSATTKTTELSEVVDMTDSADGTMLDVSLNVPLQAASTELETGKFLPPMMAVETDGGGFADELLSKIEGDDRLDAAQGLPLAQASAKVGGDREVSGTKSGTVVAHAVHEPVGDSRWGEAVAQRVSLMLGRQEQRMEMQLNPPHLGPMQVQLTLGSDQASVVFASQNAAVREALSAATPRLTALLADQGIQLVNVQVASDSLNQQTQQQAQQQAAFNGQGESRREAFPFGYEIETSAERRVLTGLNLPVARSGVSLYV